MAILSKTIGKNPLYYIKDFCYKDYLEKINSNTDQKTISLIPKNINLNFISSLGGNLLDDIKSYIKATDSILPYTFTLNMLSTEKIH